MKANCEKLLSLNEKIRKSEKTDPYFCIHQFNYDYDGIRVSNLECRSISKHCLESPIASNVITSSFKSKILSY